MAPFHIKDIGLNITINVNTFRVIDIFGISLHFLISEKDTRLWYCDLIFLIES